jgi:hypothetical protein
MKQRKRETDKQTAVTVMFALAIPESLMASAVSNSISVRWAFSKPMQQLQTDGS